ncbi:MAG: protein kinase [Gemmatimonadota bacterium]
MPRFGLSLKIFLGTAAVVTAVLAITLFVTSASARSNAGDSIERGLRETNARVAEQLRSRQKELAGKLQVFAQNPVVVQNIVNDSSGNNAFDQAGVAVEASGAKWVQVLDAAGIVLAKSDDRSAKGRDISQSPLVVSALQGTAASGMGVFGDTTIIQLVAIPMLSNLNNAVSAVGVLLAAEQIGDSLASAIGATTGSQVAFYVIDSTGAPRIVGSSIPAAERKPLQDELSARLRDTTMRAAPTPAARTDSGPAAKKDTSAMGKASAQGSIDIGGTAYVGQTTPIFSAGGSEIGGFLAMRSLDAELAGFYDLRRKLLLAGAVGLIVAFLLSGAITRQIVRPVTALVMATRRAADGDYAAEIPAGGGDEIGTLADAVRRLLGDLRDKQALVDFLGGGRAMATGTLVGGDGDATALMPGVAPRTGVLMPGQSLGVRYDIKATLGAGGMGMVYRAVDRELQEVVAIKTLKPEILAGDDTALERFKSEIRLARKISHRNVVRTHDLGEANGLYFITMEFVEGTSLKDLVRARGRLPVQVLLPIAKQLCRALEVAHEAGVIHRDIKPQNMVVEGDGTLKVMDFGIARLASRAPQQGLTQAGMVIGTPEYMAPEQLLGDELDARADIYSAGVVLYECLTGKVPFDAPTPIALISRVLEETPVAPHAAFADIPQVLSALVMRAMSRDRDARPATAQLFHDALEQIG